jgi:hypothetical protein
MQSREKNWLRSSPISVKEQFLVIGPSLLHTPEHSLAFDDQHVQELVSLQKGPPIWLWVRNMFCTKQEFCHRCDQFWGTASHFLQYPLYIMERRQCGADNTRPFSIRQQLLLQNCIPYHLPFCPSTLNNLCSTDLTTIQHCRRGC